MSKEFQSEAFIAREDGKLVQVMPDTSKEYEKGYGYLHGDYVYIYRGRKSTLENAKLKPGSVYIFNNEKIWIKPTEELAEIYHKSKIKMYDSAMIFQAIQENARKEEPPAVLETSQNAFIPTIYDDDDILKRIIKEVLVDKKIEIRASKKYRNNYDITNLKSGIQKMTPLSIKYFTKWIEILGLEVEITCKYTDNQGNEKIIRKEF